MKPNKFFYCQSYQMFNLALYHKFVLDEPITVITNADNIAKACVFLDVEHICHKNFTQRELIIRQKSVKKVLKQLVKEIGKNQFHFSHTQFAVFNFLLVKHLIKEKNIPYFHNYEFLYEKFNLYAFKIKNIVKAIKLKVIGVLYKFRHLELRKANKNNVMISLKMSFVNKNCKTVHYNTNDYYKKTCMLFEKIDFDHPKIDHLFVAQNIGLKTKYINNPQVENDTSLLDVLRKYSFYIKTHPKLERLEDSDGLSELPEYLPVEFFFNKVIKSIVSFHSASLITASRFKNIKVISLVKLPCNDDPFFKSIINDLNEKSNSNIYFPESLSEFIDLLNDVENESQKNN
jgi:hypothetical protein